MPQYIVLLVNNILTMIHALKSVLGGNHVTERMENAMIDTIKRSNKGGYLG
jgi:hypothetical protein